MKNFYFRIRYGKQPWKYYLATEEQIKDIEIGIHQHNDERDFYGRSGYYDAGELEMISEEPIEINVKI